MLKLLRGVQPLPHPERYTIHEVGRPMDFELENYEKRYSPHKYYVYRIKGLFMIEIIRLRLI